MSATLADDSVFISAVGLHRDDIKRIITKIMKVRELSGDENWGAVTINNIMSQTVSTADLLSIELKVDNKIEVLGGDK